MRYGKVRFPFIIDSRGCSGISPEKNRQEDDDVSVKLSRILKIVVLMESSLDEVLAVSKPVHGLEDFLSGFMKVMDGLDSLRDAILKSGQEEWNRGIGILYAKLLKLLSEYGMERTAVPGTAFDPGSHEAVGSEPGLERPDGTVTQVVENGWRLGHNILRTAKVIVARKAD